MKLVNPDLSENTACCDSPRPFAEPGFINHFEKHAPILQPTMSLHCALADQVVSQNLAHTHFNRKSEIMNGHEYWS